MRESEHGAAPGSKLRYGEGRKAADEDMRGCISLEHHDAASSVSDTIHFPCTDKLIEIPVLHRGDMG